MILYSMNRKQQMWKAVSEEQYEAYNLSVQEEDDTVLNDCLFELDEIFRTKQELLDSL